VKSVDADKLSINWWARDEMQRQATYKFREDAQLKKTISSALLYDPRVMSFEVDVDVTNGVATLTGTVDNLKAKRAAEADAKNTMGVWRVRNRIAVRPRIVPAASQLASRVSEALGRDPYVERFDVNVTAINGKVYLDGEVNTSFEKRQAEEVASRVNGVVTVKNNLEYDYEWAWKPDWEIKEDVESQLFWSPYVDADDVTVNVDGGVVTLTGQVDSFAEKQDAEENAFEGGAKDVRNHVSVKYMPYYSYLN
jgi:osmotically-inducible protein OsmY